MMSFRLSVSRKNVYQLQKELEKARQSGDLNRLQKISAILSLAEGYAVSDISSILNVGISSIYEWVKKFLHKGISGLCRKFSPGRPAKLTKKKRSRLANLLELGPEACGFLSSCWRSPMIQELILREFGVLFSVHYICELLKNMGFTFQKARFVAAAQDEIARQKWLEYEWPTVLKQAKKKGAYLLFGDESSLPQWG